MKNRLITLSCIVLALLSFFAAQNSCQRTGVTLYEEGTMDGYTLLGIPNPALIDMDGNVIKRWPLQTGFPAKMMPGGDVLGSKIDPNGIYPVIQQSWSGEEVWAFSDWNPVGGGQRQDIEREGNPVGYYAPDQPFLDQGNTLVLATQLKYVPEISNKPLKDDVIYEVDWNRQLTGYEWHATDHFDEFGFDEAAKEAIYRNPVGGDWFHINAMSYVGKNKWYDETGDERFNPNNLIISSWRTCLMFIISKETGKVVWKVGPDYDQGPEANLGQIQGQHHVHMVPKGLPGEGNILLHDNGAKCGYGGNVVGWPKYKSRHYSRVIEFNPVTLEKVWEFGGPGEELFYSEIVGCAQRLPNGNTLVTVGEDNRTFEVTRDKKIVWDFTAKKQLSRDLIYRAYRVPPEWLPFGENSGNYIPWE